MARVYVWALTWMKTGFIRKLVSRSTSVLNSKGFSRWSVSVIIRVLYFWTLSGPEDEQCPEPTCTYISAHFKRFITHRASGFWINTIKPVGIGRVKARMIHWCLLVCKATRWRARDTSSDWNC
jgi:hypothetical protein